MQPPATKRQRLDNSELETVSTPLRSEIWFNDGNIVLQAETTQFKIYKGTLSSHSTVLKDLFENMEETKGVDGCPLLILDDNALDVDIILRALTDRWSYPANEALPFDVVAAFLRLGRKYEIKPLYDDGYSRLSVICPPTLEDYLNFQRKATRIKYGDLTEIIVEIVIVARELSLHSILPSALYFLTCSIANEHAPPGPSILSRMHHLSNDDRDLVLHTLHPLRVAHADHLFAWLTSEELKSDICAKRAQCAHNKLQLALRIWKPPHMGIFLIWWTEFDKLLCASCAATGRKHHTEGREQLWKKLPAFYGLPPWEEETVTR